MRLIDADEAIEKMLKLLDHHLMMCNYSADSATQDCIEVINEATVVDAVPVVHGRWIQTDKADIVWRECSVCGDRRISTWFGKNVKAFNYCPKCGAKMDVEDKL